VADGPKKLPCAGMATQVTLTLFACAVALLSATAATVATPEPELRNDEGIVRALRELQPGHAAVLGQAKVVGPFNASALQYGLDQTGPRARNYSLKMVWAADRERALFVGANHAVPHRLNDVWEFDLKAMSWVLLYAPDLSRSYKGMGDDASDVVFRDGWLQTRRGGPAVIGHGWWGVTYDPTRRELLFMNRWLTDQDTAVRQVGGDPKLRYTGPPLWKFVPGRRAWVAQKTPKPHPASPMGAMLEYVPELGGAIWHMNAWDMRATWLYDPERSSWSELIAGQTPERFRDEAPGRELVGYHDPERKLVVAQQGRNTFHFDTARKSWRRVVAAAADNDRVPNGHDARTVFHHDPASGQGLLVDFAKRAVWAYDPDALTWARVQTRGDAMPRGERMLAYVDKAEGVLVVIHDRLVWAYRHGR
jgi:hypothetical protein